MFRRNVLRTPRLPPPIEAHTRFDVVFARDMIDHSAQAVALSNLTIVKDGLAPEILDIADRIRASTSRHTDELQTLLVDWGIRPDDRQLSSTGCRGEPSGSVR